MVFVHIGKHPLQANFNRYTPEVTDRLARIAAARARVEASEIRPAAEDQLRASALAETERALVQLNLNSLTEFRRAGRLALYEAVRRHGGSRAWAKRLGWTARV